VPWHGLIFQISQQFLEISAQPERVEVLALFQFADVSRVLEKAGRPSPCQ
jgi:hypothetical protein